MDVNDLNIDVNITSPSIILNTDISNPITTLNTDIINNIILDTQIVGGVGPPGVGVPIGGTTNQILVKVSNTNYDTIWRDNISLYYSEPVFTSINNDIVYVSGINPVPDFIYDNTGDMIFTLVAA